MSEEKFSKRRELARLISRNERWSPPKEVMDQLESVSNSTFVSKAIKHLQPTEGAGESSSLEASKKNIVWFLTIPRMVNSLPPTDFDTAFENLQKLPGFEDWTPQFSKLRSRIGYWRQQNLDLPTLCRQLHVIILCEDGQIILDFARHYHALLVAVGVLKADEQLVRADGSNGKALDQAYGCKMCLIEHAEKLSSAATSTLSSNMHSRNAVVIVSFSSSNKPLSKDLEEEAFLRFDFLQATHENAVDKILENIRSWSKEKFNEEMRIEGGFEGVYAKAFARKVAESGEKTTEATQKRLETALSDVGARQTLRLSMDDVSGKASDAFWISGEDLLGPEPDAHFDSEPWKELNALVGLTEVKASLRSFSDGVFLDYHRELDGKKPFRSGLCQLFLGPPGTGKTTVGKLFGRILKDFGLLTSGDFVLKNATDLIGAYIGHSEKQTKEIIRSARGKVLMIDEAYMLDPHRNESARGADPFRQGAIDTLVGEVQNTAEDDICVILCGYKVDMEKMLTGSNPGLTRRFPLANAFEFEDFSMEQLGKVLDQKLKAEEFTMTEEARTLAMDLLKLAKQRPNFGNGGEVQNILANALANYQSRFRAMSAADRAEMVKYCLQAEDLDPGYRQMFEVPRQMDQLFDGLVGLSNAKDQFEALARQAITLRKNQRDSAALMPHHFAFKGPRSVGKTTITKKLALLYHTLRLIPINEVEQVSARDIIADRMRGLPGQLPGGKSLQPRDLLARASGKILHIREAHHLTGADNNHADRVIQALREDLSEAIMQAQSDGHAVVVLSGEELGVEKLLYANVALGNMFRAKLQFPSITNDTCLDLISKQIFEQQVELTLSETERQDLLAAFKTLTRSREWTNYRDVRTISNEIVAGIYSRELQAANPQVVSGTEVLARLQTLYPRQLRPPVPFERKDQVQNTADHGSKQVGSDVTAQLSKEQGLRQILTKEAKDTSAMSKLDLFQYDNIPDGRYVRILTLEPAHEYGAPIECQLAIVWLGEEPKRRQPFDAVSYVWQSSERTEMVTCNNRKMFVPNNCELALRHLRRRTSRYKLWIDAICINQSSELEKARQVPLMGEIYGAAAHVQIWLGTASPEVDAALKRLQKLCCLRGDWGVDEVLRRRLLQMYQGQYEDFVALERVMGHEWWKRMWTFQEFVIAKKPVLVIGYRKILWEDFRTQMETFITHKDMRRRTKRYALQQAGRQTAMDRLLPTDLDDAEHSQAQTSMHMLPSWIEINDAVVCRNGFSDWLGESILPLFINHILLKARARTAKDPKDKIYGVYHLLERCGYKTPPANYSLPVAQIYQDITFALIEQSKSWWILTHLFNRRMSKTFDLPSWVPDFDSHTVWHQHSYLRLENSDELEKHLLAQEDASQRSNAKFSITRFQDGIIQTEAVFLWTVTDVTPELTSNANLDHSYEQRFEQTSSEVFDEAMEDSLFMLAGWLKTMAPNGRDGIRHDASEFIGDTSSEKYEGKMFEAIAMSFARSWSKSVIDIDGPEQLAQVVSAVTALLSTTRACMYPDADHPCRIRECGATTPHKSGEAAQHLQQWMGGQGNGFNNLVYVLYSRAVDHSLFRTSASRSCKGHFGFCRNLPRVGDDVVLLPGLADPVVIRRRSTTEAADYYRIVGVTSGIRGPGMNGTSGAESDGSFCLGDCSQLKNPDGDQSRSFYLH